MLVARTLSPVTTVFTGLWRRHFIVSLAALMAILAEVLVITLSTIPFSDGAVLKAFRIGYWVSTSIIAAMLTSLVIIYLRRRRPRLPRPPDTIAAVLSYVCGARPLLLENFAEVSTLDQDARDRWILGMPDTTYVLNREPGADGKNRWCIDYDTCTSPG